jgi:methyl-accepting chemotaxis protein
MKIRSVFLLGFAAIGLPGLAVSGWMSLRMLEAWRDADAATRTAEAMGRMMAAAETIPPQRGAIMELSHATGDISAPLAALGVTEAAAVVPALKAMRTAGLDDAGLVAAQSSMADIRRRLADYMRQPKDSRDPNLPAMLVSEMNRLLSGLMSDIAVASAQVQRQNPEIGAVVDIASLAMAMRDAAGNRGTLLTARLGGRTLTPEERSNLLVETGQLQRSWLQAQQRIRALGSPPRLVAALDSVRTNFFGEAEPRYRREAEAALRDEPGVMSFPDFRAWTQPALGQLRPLRLAAIDEAVAEGEDAARAGWLRVVSAIGATLLTLMIGAGAVLVLLRRVVQPVQALTGSITRIADGELGIDVPHTVRSDEIGTMAKAVEILRDGSRAARALAGETEATQAARLVEAERLSQAASRFEGDVASVLASTQAAATSLNNTASQLQSMAGQTVGQATAITASVGEAASAVDGAAAAAEELTASIGEISARMAETSQAVIRAAEQARSSAGQVEDLADTATRIGEVVRLIEGIAAQTNLLALNATIEAARAGEAGRGFAVVANEVKGLAAQTAHATSEIAAQITAIQTRTQAAVSTIRDVAEQVAGVSSIAAGVAAAVEQQRAATSEIARSVQVAALGTGAVTDGAGRVQGHTQDTSDEADRLIAVTSSMTTELGRLRGTVETFLGEVRPAA